MENTTNGFSRLMAMATAHLPTASPGAQRLGAVDHPLSGVGGMLTLLRSGCYVIDQAGSYRSCPQGWAREQAKLLTCEVNR